VSCGERTVDPIRATRNINSTEQRDGATAGARLRAPRRDTDGTTPSQRLAALRQPTGGEKEREKEYACIRVSVSEQERDGGSGAARVRVRRRDIYTKATTRAYTVPHAIGGVVVPGPHGSSYSEGERRRGGIRGYTQLSLLVYEKLGSEVVPRFREQVTLDLLIISISSTDATRARSTLITRLILCISLIR